MEEFDYVVVGGGSAGCVVAGRLSEDPTVTVCLLEAGRNGDSWVVKTPAALAAMVPTKLNNWAFETVPQPGLDGRRGYQPRGRALGGSSAINAMVYIRGHRWDYDHWAELGNPGWSYDELLPYFRRSENNQTIRDAFHGTDGPIFVSSLQSGNPFQQVFLEAGCQAGFAPTDDFNGEQQEGFGVYQVTQKNGERWSAARGYIHPNLGRPNLRVVTEARARRLIIAEGRATGVEYGQGGAIRNVRARHAVVVSSGALQSPQLLMLSGIGDGEELRRFGIPVTKHLPGVGRNLQDHVDYVFVYKAKSLDLVGISLAGSARLMREWARYRDDRTGAFSSNLAECGAFLRADPASPIPDTQLHFVVGIADNHARNQHLGHGFSCHVCLLRPKSRGFVGLASADPLAAPVIDPNFYGHPDDLEGMVKAFKLTRRIMDAPALASLRSEDLYTGHLRSDDDIRAVLRRRSDTIYHPVGSCRMGRDPMAVVDPQLRVHGIDGLRVADASIMPTLIGGNTNAPAIMIGEKAADLLRQEG